MEAFPHLRRLGDGWAYDAVTFAPWVSVRDAGNGEQDEKDDDDGRGTTAKTTNAFVSKEAWIDVFARATGQFVNRARNDLASGREDAETRAEAFERAFDAALEKCARAETSEEEIEALCRSETNGGGAFGAPWTGINCLELCRVRDGMLRRLGFEDCFASVKREENATALKALRGVLDRLDAVESDSERLLEVVRGCFAGNIFDLGAAASAELYDNGGVDFAATVLKLKGRPWCVDDFDAMQSRFASKTYAKAIVFVDNAGADVCLGMIPFIRELIRRGTEVVVAANSVPSINDITALELEEQIIPFLKSDELGDATLKDAIESGRLRVVASGSDMPVIDLRYLSKEIVEEARDADLVVLEGMGRGIETNLYARFSIDSVKLAMVKHKEVATLLGGELYDCVCKFDEGDC